MFGFICVFIPSAILIVTLLRAGDSPHPILAGGVATSAFLAFGLLHQVGFVRACSHKTCSPLYLIAVLVLWMSARDSSGWFIHAAMGTLLGVPMLLFIFQEFVFTGRASLHRARSLVRRLGSKTDWPANLVECKALPEVKALREALRDNAEPALVLLMNPKPEVRIAALTALEFRPAWNKGQAELVLKAAKYATEPPVRAAAMTALANVDDPSLVSNLAMYLRDMTREVRTAAAEALLWDAERRWSHIRRELRTALSDFRCCDDGPLPCSGPLPSQAISDLTMWAGESASLGLRSTLTLRNHFRRELNENASPELVEEIGQRIRDGRVTSALRVELAHLLSEVDCATPGLWLPLLEAGQPSALRLLAAGALLQSEHRDQALVTLREVARVPNREMALQVAAIVQRNLRVDMGLPLTGPLPEPKSKQAAEIARRVIDWAEGRTPIVESAAPRRSRISTIARHIQRPTGELPRRRA
jgi:HEAT repeat protein